MSPVHDADHNLTPTQRQLPRQVRRAAYGKIPMTCDLVRQILDEAAAQITRDYNLLPEDAAMLDAAISHAFLRIRDEVTQPFRDEQMRLLFKLMPAHVDKDLTL